ncbi:hypothetical protein NLG97_g2289 [Lecanicillium saksenae]|uniref:Uncharacterized protein n=1 Tax=Lecanicillium saksenae TaxID=468837 RepID=A0ACC1R1L4_9HYPO|nr:hypothetical protein NLG97_g2289 [Lecanicillium saksenae]
MAAELPLASSAAYSLLKAKKSLRRNSSAMIVSKYLRATALGATIRLASNGRYLGYAVKGPISTIVCDLSNSDHAMCDDELVVDWSSTDDDENPQNWSVGKKVFVSTLICLYTFTVYCGSSIYVPSVEQLRTEFKVSETLASLGLAMYVLGYGLGPLLFSPLSEIPQIGRNPIYITTFFVYFILSIGASVCHNFAGFIVLRFLMGFFGSPCLATGAASLGDMLSVVKIPYAMSAWSGAMYAGPALGPLMSGYAVVAKGWRWSMWELSWLSALVFVLLFSLLPETAAPTLLYYKARRIRQQTGNPGYKIKGSSDFSRGSVIRMALVKPFEITIKDPAIAFTNFYVSADTPVLWQQPEPSNYIFLTHFCQTSFTYGIYYSFFEVFPLVYPKIYGMGTGDTSAVFLCVLIACILGALWYCLWYRLTTEPRFHQLGTFDVPETFLRPGLLGVFGFPIGLLLFGWAARASVPWPVPTLGIVIVCGCSFVVGIGIFIHLPLSYPRYAASLFAANDALRSAFATAAILFGRPLYVNMGVARGCTLLAGISSIGVLGFWYLYLRGDKLRQRSKFTVQ